MSIRTAGLVLLVLGLAGAGACLLSGRSRPTPAVTRAAAQPTADPDEAGPDGPALQERIRGAARKAVPSVVAIGGGPSVGSGVIVSADGLILSQRHVVSIPFPEATPGSKIPVLLADGTKAEAELLGVDPLYDLAALRLTGPGPYPHSPLAAEDAPRLGDGVLKLGHPVGGPTEGRPPVVRFGRVVVRTSDQFVCDCLVNGGDSGGPFVDLRGRVVGLQGPPGIAASWPARNQRSERFAVDQMDGRDNYLDTGRAAALLRKRLPALTRRQVLPVAAADRAEKRADDVALAAAPTLPVGRWTQGAESLGRFQTAGAGCVVELLGRRDRVIALGTVVDGAGLVLTTAAPAVTESPDGPGQICCRLPGGRVAAAEVVGVDPAYNLALLRVRADGLEAVAWAGGPDPSVGTLVAAVGPGGLPRVAGVVSVPRRQVPRPRPVPTSPTPAAPPELTGTFVPGGGFRVESSEGRAFDGGIRPGDVVLSAGGTPVRSSQDLVACAVGRRAGERVAARVLRAGRTVDFSLTLPPDLRNRQSFDSEFYPPVAFEGDLPILPGERGCPVVGLDGKAVGVTVGRIAPQACLIVPVDRVVARLADLTAGKPLAALPQRPDPVPPAGPGRPSDRDPRN